MSPHLEDPVTLLHRGICGALIGLVLLSFGCAPSTTIAPPSHLEFPAPDTGPGAPALERSTQRTIDQGWEALERGDVSAARANAKIAGQGPAARLLELQATVIAHDDDPIPGLEDLTTDEPDYAAALLTLSVAAEQANFEDIALDAARRGAELWPAERWTTRAQNLHQRWIGDRITSASRFLEADETLKALESVEPVLTLEPTNREAVLIKAQAFLARGELDDADIVLVALPQDPDALLLAGKIAEERGDWQTAMSLYGALPEDNPEREKAVYRARLRWRLSVLPEYVHSAMNSSQLNRAGLAVVLISLAPQTETMGGGEVPLLSDIVALPSQREIITAVRLGILQADTLDHLFYPDQHVTTEDVQNAVVTLCVLLGTDPPLWCSEEITEQCANLSIPINGPDVTDLVLTVVEEAGG